MTKNDQNEELLKFHKVDDKCYPKVVDKGVPKITRPEKLFGPKRISYTRTRVRAREARNFY